MESEIDWDKRLRQFARAAASAGAANSGLVFDPAAGIKRKGFKELHDALLSDIQALEQRIDNCFALGSGSCKEERKHDSV